MTAPTTSADFPFEANYVEVNGAKMHYVDEGTGDPILFLHGNPTSSYLWRNIIPQLTAYGRCIAPDLMGMGKSDKPDSAYRVLDHVDYLDAFITALDLKNITLVIHDWGSALGFHYARRNPDNIKGIAFMEALMMPTPSWEVMGDFADTFRAFRTPGIGEELLMEKNIFIEQILPGGIMRDLSDTEMNAYRAPFAKPEDRRPILQFPRDIPIAGEPQDMVDMVGAYNQWLQESDLPKLLIYATPGMLITDFLVGWCKENLKNLTMTHIGAGLHYIQEDQPDALSVALSDWVKAL